jgi:hypothetical protein
LRGKFQPGSRFLLPMAGGMSKVPAAMDSAVKWKLGVALFIAGAAAVAAGSELERAATLEAIHQLENPRNVTRPGPRGELGPYQFRAVTWRMHTTEPFTRAVERSVAHAVAELHYDWLERGLKRAGLPVTPYMVGLAWNAGLSAAINGRAPRIAHDYASRAANLTRVLRTEMLLASSN